MKKIMQVIKRDGEAAEFTLTKINDAIMKAFNATQKSYTNDIIDLLALRVTADFSRCRAWLSSCWRTR